MQFGVSFFYLLIAAGMLIPKLNRQERVCIEGSTQASNKRKNGREILICLLSLASQPFWLEEIVYEVLSLTSNSFRVSILVWWCGRGTQSLKEPVALDSAGRRGVHQGHVQGHLTARASFLRYLLL